MRLGGARWGRANRPRGLPLLKVLGNAPICVSRMHGPLLCQLEKTESCCGWLQATAAIQSANTEAARSICTCLHSRLNIHS
jgi:hypothetical protein